MVALLLSAMCANSLETWYMMCSGYSSCRIANCIDRCDCLPTAFALFLLLLRFQGIELSLSLSLSSKNDVPVELGVTSLDPARVFPELEAPRIP